MLSIQMKNGFETGKKRSTIMWNGKERVPSYTERIPVASECIH
jgi:hypothetical protein